MSKQKQQDRKPRIEFITLGLPKNITLKQVGKKAFEIPNGDRSDVEVEFYDGLSH
jgi:hypothetical protein